ncbi:MAG: DUF559 domain-containing protein [Oscillospiraceae bacterium]|nr:DUF559 domain-containing protein [Oscillospiraceae bacterium]
MASKRNYMDYLSMPYNPKLRERARELRKAGNLSETLIWNQIKKNKLNGLDFDRQKIIGNYIVDFFCASCWVVIEIDGSSHDDKVEYDKERDGFLEGLGLALIHIRASDVLNSLDSVMEMLRNHPDICRKTTSPPEGGTPPREEN